MTVCGLDHSFYSHDSKIAEAYGIQYRETLTDLNGLVN